MFPCQPIYGRFFRAASILVLSIATLAMPLRAQTIDSLEQRLSEPDLSSAERVETLYLLSRELTFVDLSRSMQYANRSLELAQKTGNELGMAYAYRILGSIYATNEDYFMGLQYLHHAMELFEKKSDSMGLANCYVSLGHIYRALQNREKEIEYHGKSYEIFRRLGQEERMGVASHNLGESFYLAGRLADAEALTKTAIDLNTSLGNLPVLSNCLKVQGLIELSKGHWQEARKHFLQVLEIASQLGPNSQKQAAAESYIQLAELSLRSDNPAKELEYLLQAEALCQEYDLFDFLKRIDGKLALHYMAAGNIRLAQEYLKKEHETSELFSRKLIRDRSRLTDGMVNIASLTEKTSELQSKTQAQSAEIQTRNYLLLALGLSAILLIWLVFKAISMNRHLHAKGKIILRQKSDLEALNKTKDKFFKVVAHDIRSPLVSLKSFASLLTDDYHELSPAEVKSMGRQLEQSVDSTLRMADNLILWAADQMQHSPVSKGPVTLKDVLQDVYDVYREMAQQKDIELAIACDGETQVYANRDQLEFILRNLVNNALKFTPRYGRVTLGVRTADEGNIQVFVSDTGVGMESDILQGLFVSKNTTSRQGTQGEDGSGLGLGLSQDFAARNQGHIEVVSARDQGTTFFVTFKKAA